MQNVFSPYCCKHFPRCCEAWPIAGKSQTSMRFSSHVWRPVWGNILISLLFTEHAKAKQHNLFSPHTYWDIRLQTPNTQVTLADVSHLFWKWEQKKQFESCCIDFKSLNRIVLPYISQISSLNHIGNTESDTYGFDVSRMSEIQSETDIERSPLGTFDNVYCTSAVFVWEI